MLTFAYPAFLGALFALAVPIILHLLNRNHSQTLVFPSIQFLQKTALPREGRRKLRDLLLLLIRMLLFTLLILLLARPQWQKKEAPNATSSGRKGLLFLLDQSVSMRTAGQRARIQKIITEQMKAYSDWDCGLIGFSQEPKIIFRPSQKASQQILKWANNDLSFSFLTGDPDSALKQAAVLLSPYDKKRLLVLSDCQSNTWKNISAALSVDTEISFFPELALPPHNAAIIQVHSTPLNHKKLRLTVELQNFGDSEENRTLSVRLGSQHQQQHVSIGPQKNTFAIFIFDQKDILIQGNAKLDLDAMPFDDQYSFWCGNPIQQKILAVLDDSPKNSQASALEFFFLQKAMNTKTAKSYNLFSIQSIDSSLLSAINLDDCQQLFLLGCAEHLSSDTWQKITTFIKQGGSLFITPGSSPQTALHLMQQCGLTKTRFLGIIGSDSKQAGLGLGWVQPDSCLGRLFTPQHPSDLFLFALHKYVHVSTPNQPNEKIILKTLDQRPALLQWTLEKGNAYFFTFNFTPQWSDFVLSQSFLPTINELCRCAIGEQTLSKKLYCGQTPPHYEQLNGTQDQPDRPINYSEPGLYQIGAHPIEYHIDPKESHLEVSKIDNLKRFLTRGINKGLPQAEYASPANPPIKLWKWTAILLALMVLLEGIAMTTMDRKDTKH